MVGHIYIQVFIALFNPLNNENDKLIIKACFIGDLNKVKTLCDLGAHIEHKNKDGFTPVYRGDY
jgi:hypothetical protein